MTDTEIKKALECCIDMNCRECVFNKGIILTCYDDLKRNLLDLLNRKDAEIERLNENCKDLISDNEIMEVSSEILNDLQELYQRLVLNYNDGVPFEQMEEDRLTVGNAIDLLSSQKAEIERLKAPKYLIENSFSEKEISEILKSGRYGIIPHVKFTVSRIDEDGIKAEAYKDLAEKLKAKKKRAYFENEGFYWCVLAEDIDAVLKEFETDDRSKVRPIPILRDITLGGDADI